MGPKHRITASTWYCAAKNTKNIKHCIIAAWRAANSDARTRHEQGKKQGKIRKTVSNPFIVKTTMVDTNNTSITCPDRTEERTAGQVRAGQDRTGHNTNRGELLPHKNRNRRLRPNTSTATGATTRPHVVYCMGIIPHSICVTSTAVFAFARSRVRSRVNK